MRLEVQWRYYLSFLTYSQVRRETTMWRCDDISSGLIFFLLKSNRLFPFGSCGWCTVELDCKQGHRCNKRITVLDQKYSCRR